MLVVSEDKISEIMAVLKKSRSFAFPPQIHELKLKPVYFLNIQAEWKKAESF